MIKTVGVRLIADIGDYLGKMRQAGLAAKDLGSELDKAAKSGKLDEIAKGALVAGAAISAGLGLATKAAINWESAWTGVAKVVDGSPEQLAALEQELRDLTQILPQSHAEIANVAAAAGQLGVRRQDIADFTEVMVMMGTATNLSSEEAAFALARMMNIMQTAPSDVDRLGSAVVDLGNNFATTEAEIVSMALRISGAGHTIGMSEADVLGYAAALSSVGIEAEAGGTAISTAFVKIASSVRGGGKELETFARVAGMSASDFKRAFEQDAARATAAFIQGLAGVDAAGGDVFETLEELGLSQIRMRDAMLRLAGAGDVLTTALDISNRGWDENAALIEEAERRYGTVEARMQLARNSVTDLAVDIGQTLMPAVGALADGISALGNFFGDLPGPVQATVTILAGVTGVSLLALAAFIKTRGALQRMNAELAATGPLGARAAAGLGVVGRVLAGPWGLAIGAGITALTAFGIAQGQAAQRVEELIDTLDAETGALTRSTRAWVAKALVESDALDISRELGINSSTLVDVIMQGADATREYTQRLNEQNREAGHSEQLYGRNVGLISRLDTELIVLARDLETARDTWAAVNEATGEAEVSMENLDPAARQLGETLGITAGRAQELAGEFDDLDKEFKAFMDTVFGVQNAEDALHAAMDKLTEGIRKQKEAGDANAGSFVGQSEAARENRAALQEVLAKMQEATLETLKHSGSTDEATAALEAFKDEARRQAEQVGINIEEIEGYNDVVSEIERQIAIQFKANIGDAESAIAYLRTLLDGIPRTKFISIQAQIRGVDVASGLRWGGYYEHAQDGVLRDAGIFSSQMPARYAFAEPATGGEAFIPKFGDKRRSMAILDHAAGWYDAAVVPRGAWYGTGGMGGRGGGGVHYTFGDISITVPVDRLEQLRTIDDFAAWVADLRNNQRRGMVNA